MTFILTACNQQTTTPTNQTINTNATYTTVNGEEFLETFINFEGDRPAKMTGSKDKEYQLYLPEGGFYMIMKSKDPLHGLNSIDLVSAESGIGLPIFSYFGAGRAEDGWYVYERVEHMYSAGDIIVDVEADGPYVIEIYKLPNTTIDKSLPLSVNGFGTKAIGPFSANGSLTIQLKTLDAKNAGFVVTLIDAQTGLLVESVYMNVNTSTQTMINQVDTTEIVETGGSGRYFVHITANKGCNWEVNIN